MNKQKSRYIGVDVGGTKILVESFDEQINLIYSMKVATVTNKGSKGFMEQLEEQIGEAFHAGIEGIAVAVPGIVNRKTGQLIRAPHLPIPKDFPIRDLLHERFHKPIYVDHDINAFLMAESGRRELKKLNNLVAVMVGTGVGGAIMIDGKIFYGKDGYAGEVGHMVINQSAKRKTLEENTGGYDFSKIGAKKALEYLGIGLANLNLILHPDAFVLGGSVYLKELSKHKKKLEKAVADHSLDKTCPPLIDASKQTSVAKGIVMLMQSGRR